ncbi:hypothetical protein H2199_004102 [Coniosporium tulheliwenetii]|uniref:Uncharacterized protein n=1 Tax=Coniosporium tulheliwenetii TaxID=3383036 RepID=A0ACC2Z7B2_9PEZI|nr:hypothetical protein H2199_004102 [Cladosporium sp. JES 115]
MTTAAVPLQLTPTPGAEPQSRTNGTNGTNGTSSVKTAHDGITIPRGPVTSKLQFYSAPKDGSAPYQYVEAAPEGEAQRNFGEESHEVTIDDIRGKEHTFTLNDNAFETLSGIQSNEHAFQDDARIKEVYYPEVEKLILDNVPGAHRVLLFDHTIRRAQPNAHRAPVTRVHIDQTPASAEARVRHHLPDEADELLRGRYRIINVWRPLNGPVVSFPLAFADSATTRDEDLVGIQHRYPHRTGETAGVKHSSGQRWYYWSGMTDSERLLLKCFDSDETVGRWGRVPHTAFVDPRTQEGWPARESIEVRALVFG